MTKSEYLAERITSGIGSMPSVLFHVVAFVSWITWNLLSPPSVRFDPYSFSCLTMVVSLEAIFLTIFVLITQNRQAAADRAAIARDAQTNKEALAEIQTILHLLRQKEVQS